MQLAPSASALASLLESPLDHAAPAPAPAAAPAAAPAPHPALQLSRQGWHCTRNFFSADEVAVLRRLVHAGFDAPELQEGIIRSAGIGSILVDLFKLPEVARRLFVPRMARVLRELIGPGFVLLPEHAAHRDGYGGWHKDTDMFERAGSMDHWNVDYGVYQCAVYLQDNTAENGGGLSVVPGSHRVPKPDRSQPDAAQRYEDYTRRHGVLLDSRAGDLVVFHTRMDHRATPKQVEQPDYGNKLALFFIAATDNRRAAAYSEFIHRRPDYTYLRNYQVPQDLQALAAQQGFRFGL
ncbi:MAG: phytanoyl-CoA dioxygenase family protein [Aquincola tertiaricarbonis]